MKKYGLSVLLAALLLAACETTTVANYNAVLDTWVGQSDRDLILKWGIPDREYRVDAQTRLISYKSRRQVYYPGTPPHCYGGYYGRRGFHDPFGGCSGGFPPEIRYLSCETTFTSVKGAITQWRHTGNDCRS